MSDNNNVDIHIRGHADGLRPAVNEAKSTIADLKSAVVDKTSQMIGVSQELINTVAGLAPALLTAGAAAAVVGKAYADGSAEVRKMTLAVAQGGDIAGESAASMRANAAEMANHSQMTIAQAKEIEVALAASGQVGAAAFRQITALAGNFALVMGTDVAKVGPELVKLFDEPAKGAEELNKRLHFLSVAELDHIAHLQRMGEVTQAQTELASLLGDRLAEIAPKLGIVERAWDNLRGAASKAWDAMMGIGREAAPHDAIKGRLDAVLAQIKDAENSPTMRGMLPELMQKALRLQDQLEAEAQKSFDKQQGAEKNRRDQAARSLANPLSKTARAEAIDDEIKQLEAADLRADIKAEAIAKKREEREKLFAEKISAPKSRRDLFADTVAETSGVNRGFTEQLAALKGGLDAGRISEEAYIGTVEKLIQKQPFATKELQETIRELAAKERVLNKVDAAETTSREVVEKAGEAHAQRNEDLRLEIELMGKNAAERARLTAFRKIDADLARDEAKLTDRLGKIGDLDGIDAGVAKLREGAEQAKGAWLDAHDTIEMRQRDWIAGARDGLQSYADEAARSADAMASAFKRGAQMAEDAIANFVVTGKLDIASLAKFAATELARQNIAKPIVSEGSKLINSLLPGIGNLFNSGGGAAAAAETTAMSAWAALPFAKGNVFNSADLAGYRNTIVSSPTLFKFAQGGAFRKGLMGEKAGSPGEAIIPLSRMSDGDLGVKAQILGGGEAPAGSLGASSAGAIQVVVYDQRTAPTSAPVSVEQGSGPDGMQQIKVFVRDEVRSQITGGQQDSAMRARFGVTPVLTRRG